MYGKLMSISDELMWRYWILLTDLPQSQIDEMQKRVKMRFLHPMQAKKDLAFTITSQFHSEPEAQNAAENWSLQFQSRSTAAEVPEVTVSLSTEGLLAPVEAGSDAPARIKMAKLLQILGLASSTNEATRKIAEGAVLVNNQRFTGRTISREELGTSPTMRLGRRTLRVFWEN